MMATEFTPTVGRWTLISTVLASSMAFIDGQALTLIIPTLQKPDVFDATGSQVFWVVNAYLVFLAALILVGGALGDHLGRKRIFMVGIVIFTIASMACGLSPSIEFLIGARAVQGVGGALMVPGSLALISALFPGDQKGRAIGTWSAFSTISTVFGLILGGLLAGEGLWRFVFFINLPLALISLYILVTQVPESRDTVHTGPLDIVGGILATLGLAGIAFGFLQMPELGLSPVVVGALAGGVIALILFVWWERRAKNPMMPLDLFKSRTFSGANLLTLFLYGALAVMSTFLSLNMIQIQGYKEIETSLSFLPFTLLLFAISRWAGGLVDRVGPRLPLTVGPAIVGLGFLSLSLPSVTDGFSAFPTTYLPCILLIGLGMGITVAPLTTAVMGSVSSQQAGAASGINNAVARSAGVFAVAIIGAIVLLAFQSNLSDRVDEIDGLSDEQRAFMDDEAADLAAAEAPPDLDANAAGEVHSAIQWAFVDVFRLVMVISGVMAFLSAGLAFLLVENRLVMAE
jgi:EmrB/QacA subfamily drug resistance transporter